ncbi:hypothetical protein C8F01DRAFT_1318915 [Mycena amicta]|nr:hypothetical protein C8F01DRAFT_1318915 [Mycena amicta]
MGNELDVLRGHGAVSRASLAELHCGTGIHVLRHQVPFSTGYSPFPAQTRHNDGWHSLATSVTERRPNQDQGVGGCRLPRSEEERMRRYKQSPSSLLEIGRHDSAPFKHGAVQLDRRILPATRAQIGIRAGKRPGRSLATIQFCRLLLRLLASHYHILSSDPRPASDDTTRPTLSLKDW